MSKHGAMNRIFKLVRNKSTGLIVAVSENAIGHSCVVGGSRRLRKLLDRSKSTKAIFLIKPLTISLICALLPAANFAATSISIDNKTNTSIAHTNGSNTFDVTTKSIKGNNAFNSFSNFNITKGDVANLHLPENTQNLVNFISNKSYIDGTVNSLLNNNKIGGNVYFAAPNGMVISSSGVLNVGSLFISSRKFSDSERSDLMSNDYSKLSLDAEFNKGRGAEVEVNGNINAINNINIRAGKVTIGGKIYTGVEFKIENNNYASVVNLNGENQSTGAKTTIDGDVVLEAVGDDTLGSVAEVDINNAAVIEAIGDLSILADQSNTVTAMGYLKAGAKIQVNAASLSAKNITLSAKTILDSSYSYDGASVTGPDDALPSGIVEGIPTDLTNLGGVNFTYSQVVAESNINVGSGAKLVATEKVNISAENDILAGSVGALSDVQLTTRIANPLWGVGALYTQADANANVTISSGSSITAKKLDVVSHNAASAITNIASDSDTKFGVAIGVVDANINANVDIQKDAVLNLSDSLNATATNENTFENAVQVVGGKDGKAGISAAISDIKTNATVNMAANVSTKDISLFALNDMSENAVSSATQEGNTAWDSIKDNLKHKYQIVADPNGYLVDKLFKGLGLLKDPEPKELPNRLSVRAGGAIAFNKTIANAIVSVGDGAELTAANNLVIAAKTHAKKTAISTKAAAVSESGNKSYGNGDTSKTAISLGLAVADYQHNAHTSIGAGAKITAGNLGMASDVVLEPIVDLRDLFAKYIGNPGKIAADTVDKVKSINTALTASNASSSATSSTDNKDDTTSISGAVNYLNYGSSATSEVESGASITTTSTAAVAPWSINLANNWEFNFGSNLDIYAHRDQNLLLEAGKIVPSSASNKSVGTNVTMAFLTGNAQAIVREGVSITDDNDNVIVDSNSNDHVVSIAAGAGSGKSSFGFNGSAIWLQVDNNTLSSVDDEANIKAAMLSVTASDKPNILSIAGGVSASTSGESAVGIGAALNKVTTNTIAEIADNDSVSIDGDARTSEINDSAAREINVGSLLVKAHTGGEIISAGVAAAVSNKGDGKPGIIDKLQDKYTAIKDFVNGFSDVTPTTIPEEPAKVAKEGDKPAIGLAGAGSVAMNDVALNTDSIVKGVTVNQSDNTKNINVTSLVDTNVNAGSGGAAINRNTSGQDKKTVGIVGSVAYNSIDNKTVANIIDSTLTQSGGLSVNAISAGEQLSVALGLAASQNSGEGSQNLQFTGAGSITFAKNNVDAGLISSTINSATDIDINAYSRNYIGTGTGALSLTLGAAKSVGASISYAQIDNSTKAHVSATTIKNGKSVVVNAKNASEIAAGAAQTQASTGESSLAIGGASTISLISNDTEASIDGSSNLTLSDSATVFASNAGADASLDALITGGDAATTGVDYCGNTFSAGDSAGNCITSVSGNVQASIGAGSSNVGASINFNQIANNAVATIDNSTVTAQNNLDVNALSTSKITSIAAGVGYADEVSVAGSATINIIDNSTKALIEGTDASKQAKASAKNLNINASDKSTINTLAGQVSVSKSGAALGAAVSSAFINNNVLAQAEQATITSDNIDVSATTDAQIGSIAAAGGASSENAFSASVVINNIGNNTRAIVNQSDVNQSDPASSQYANISAKDSSTIDSLAGSVSGGGTAAAGAALAYNHIANQVASILRDSKVNGAYHFTIAADQVGSINTISAAASVAGSAGFSGSISINHIADYGENDPRTLATIDNSNLVDVANVAVNAKDTTAINSVAGAVAVSNAGFGAAVADNYSKGNTSALVNNSNITGANADLAIEAINQAQIKSMSVAGAGGETVGIAGSASSNRILNTTLANLLDSDTSVENVSVNALAEGSIQSLAGGVAGSGTAAVGAAVAVNRIANNTDAYISGKKQNGTQASNNVVVSSKNKSSIDSIAVSGVGSGGAAIGGSTAINLINNSTLSQIEKSAKVVAGENVGVLAQTDDGISTVAGVAAGGADVGVGASVVVSQVGGQTTANIDNSEVIAQAQGDNDIGISADSGKLNSSSFSLNALPKDLAALRQQENLKGVVVNASATHRVQGALANVAAGTVGLSGLVNSTQISSSTSATVTNNSQITGGNNAGLAVSAADHTLSSMALGSVTVGAGAAGATVDYHGINTNARANIDNSKVSVQKALSIHANNTQQASSDIFGGAFGGVAAIGAGGVVKLGGSTEASLTNSNDISSADADIKAERQAQMDLLTGNIAAGGVSVGASFNVGLDQGNTIAKIDTSTLNASGNVTVDADNKTNITNKTAAGALGASAALAGSVAVVMVDTKTKATINNSTLGSDGQRADKVELHANDNTTVNQLAGAAAGSFMNAGGAAISLQKIDNSTLATVSDSSIYAASDIDIAANTTRKLDQNTAAFGVAATGAAAGAVGVLLVDEKYDSNNSAAAYLGSSLTNVSIFSNSDTLSDNSANDGGGLTADEINNLNAGSKFNTLSILAAENTNDSSSAKVINSTLDAIGDISVTGRENDAINLKVGGVSLAAGAIAGMVGVANVTHNINADIDNSSSIKSAGALKVGSQVLGGLNVKAEQFAGGVLAGGAAIAIANSNNNISSSLVGASNSSSTNVSADDKQSVSADAQGAGVGALIGGASVAHANKSGTTQAQIGGLATATLADLSINATRTGNVDASALASAAGLVGVGAGADAKANDSGSVNAILIDNSVVNAAKNVNISAEATPSVLATAKGNAAAAGIAVGISNASATSAVDVSSSLGNNTSINATNSTINAKHSVGDRENAKADATASSGALAGVVNATESEAINTSDVALTFGAGSKIDVTGDLTLNALNNSQQLATSSAHSGAILARGGNVSKAKSNSTIKVNLGSNVKAKAKNNITLQTDGKDINTANAVAGSGGFLSGIVASISSGNTSETTVDIGNANELTAAKKLNISTNHTSDYNGKLDTSAASVAGYSGGHAQHSVSSDVGINIGENSTLTADDIKLSANNKSNKAWLNASNAGDNTAAGDKASENINAGAGGLLNGSAITSDTQINHTTAINIQNQTKLKANKDIIADAKNSITSQDKLKLSSGGAIQLADAKSNINVSQADAAINIGTWAILESATGNIGLGASSDAQLDARVAVDVFGLAGSPGGTTDIEYQGNNAITVAGSATVIAHDGSISLNAGEDSSANSGSINANSNTNIWNNTALPLSSDPVAKANINNSASLDIATDARILSASDINLSADLENSKANASGVAKDIYRETAAKIANAIGHIFGASKVSFETRTGENSISGTSNVNVGGDVEAGIGRNITIELKDKYENDIASGYALSYSLENAGASVMERINNLKNLESAYHGSAAGEAYAAEIKFLENKLVELGLATWDIDKDGKKVFNGGKLMANGSSQQELDNSVADNLTKSINHINNKKQNIINSNVATINSNVATINSNNDTINSNDLAIDNLEKIDTNFNSLSAAYTDDKTNTNYQDNLNNAIANLKTSLVNANIDASWLDDNKNLSLIGTKKTKIEGGINSQIDKYKNDNTALTNNNTALTNNNTTLTNNNTALTNNDKTLISNDNNFSDDNISISDLINTSVSLTKSSNDFSTYLKKQGELTGDALAVYTAKGSGLSSEIVAIPDINIKLGSINIKATTLTGNGKLSAMGDGSVDIIDNRNATLKIGNINIDSQAPKIKFNGGELKESKYGDIATYTGGTPSINIKSNFVPNSTNASTNHESQLAPDIFLNGDINNSRGSVNIDSKAGTLYAKGSISADTVNVVLENGDFVQGYVNGFYHVAGNPTGTQAGTGVIANGAVMISARYLNVNGLIQSGIANLNLKLDLKFADHLNDISVYDKDGSQISLANLKPDLNSGYKYLLVRNDNSNIDAYYDPKNQQILVDSASVNGGQIDLYGQIINTNNASGAGQLNVLDGYGEINIDNESGLDINLGNLSTGKGVAGRITISDIQSIDANGKAIINQTTYTRLNGYVSSTTKHFNANGISVTDDPINYDKRTPRIAYYNPQQGLDYIDVTGKQTTTINSYSWSGTGFLGISELNTSGTTGQVASQVTSEELSAADLPSGNTVLLKATTHSDNITIAAPVRSNEKSWRNCNWWTICIAQNVHATFDETTGTKTITFTSLKADNKIGIKFIGDDNGVLNVSSNSNINIAGVLENKNGGVTLISNGNITEDAKGKGLIRSANVDLTAKGSVGSAENAINLAVTGTVNASAENGNVSLAQTFGDLTVGNIQAKGDALNKLGNVQLTSDGSINTLSSGLISGNKIDLNAGNSIKANIDTGYTSDLEQRAYYGVKALAQNDISISQAQLNKDSTGKNLLVDKIVSSGGNVDVSASGSILDNNQSSETDTRTWNQLLNFWDSMGLVAGTANDAKKQDTLNGYVSSINADYQDYWAMRGNAAYDPNFEYHASEAEKNYLTAQGLSEADFDKQRTNQYHDLNTKVGNLTNSYDAKYQYRESDISDAESASLLEGSTWDRKSLAISLGQGVLKTVTDTNPVIKAPNIFGKKVTITAGQNIGEEQGNIIITKDDLTDDGLSKLSDAKKVALAAAESRDISVAKDGSVLVNQKVALNFDAADVLNIQAKNAYLASLQDARIGSINVGTGELRIKVKGNGGILQVSGAEAITAGNIVLEAANGGISNYDGSALRMNISGDLTSRAHGDINLENTGDINIESMYSIGDIYLLSTGTIQDAQNDNELDILAKNINLDAAGDIKYLEIGNQGGSLNAKAGQIILGVTNAYALNLGKISARDDLIISGENQSYLSTASDSKIKVGGAISLQAANFIMKKDSLLNAGDKIEVDTDSNIVLGEIQSSSSDAAEAIKLSAGGGIFNAFGESGVNIIADNGGIYLSGDAGIGSASTTATNSYDTTNPDALKLRVKSVAAYSKSGDIYLESATNLNVIELSGTNANLTAANDLNLNKANVTGDLTAVAGNDLNSADSLSANVATLTASNGHIQLNQLKTTDDLTANAGNDLQVETLTVGKDANLTAANDLTLKTANVTGDLTAVAGNDLNSADSLSANVATLTASKGHIQLNQLKTTDDLTASAGNDLKVETLATVGKDANLTAANDLTLKTANVTGDLTAVAGNDLNSADSLSANVATLTASKGHIQLNQLKTTDDLTANAGNDLQVETLTVGKDAKLTAANDLTLKTANVTGGLTANAGNDLQVETLTVGKDAKLTAANDLTLKTANVTGGLTASAGNDLKVETLATVGKDANLTAANNLTLNTANVTGDLTAVAGNDLNSADSLSANGATLTASNGHIQLNQLKTTDDLTANAGNDLQVETLTVGKDANLTAANDLTLNTANVTGDLTAVAGNDLQVETLATVGKDANLTAANNLTLNTANVTGDLTANAGNDLKVETLATVGKDANLTAANDLTLKTANVTGDLTAVAGNDLNSADSLSANVATLTASKGHIQLNQLKTTDDLTANAGNDLQVETLTVGKDAKLTAANDLTLKTANVTGGLTASAGNDLKVETLATVGKDANLKAARNLTLNTANVTGDLTAVAGNDLNSADSLSANGATLTASNGHIQLNQLKTTDDLTANAGNDLQVETLTVGKDANLTAANDLTLNTANVTGDLTAVAGNDLNSADSLSANVATLTASKGHIQLNQLKTTDDLTASAGNDLKVETLATVGKDANLTAANDLTLKTANVTGDLTAVAGNDLNSADSLSANVATLTASKGHIQLNQLKTTDDLTANAGNDLQVETLTVGKDAKLTAANDLTLKTANVTGGLTASAGNDLKVETLATVGKDANLKAARNLTLNTANVTGDLTAVAGNDLNSADSLSANGATLTASNGHIQLNQLKTTDDLTANAGNDLQVETLTVGKDANLTAANDLTLNTANVTGDLTAVAGNDLQVETLATVGKDANLTAANNLTLNTANVTGDLTANAGNDLKVETLATVGKDANLTAANDLTLKTANVTGDLTAVAGNDLNSADSLSANVATLTASKGHIQLNQLKTTDDLTANAGNDLQVETLTVGKDAKLTAANDLTLKTANVTGGLTAVAGNDLQVETLATVGKDANLKAARNLTLKTANVTGDLTANAGNDLQVETLTVGKDANLKATHDLALKTANVTGDLTANAGNDLQVETLAVGKDANLTATHDLALKIANVTGDLTANAGNDLQVETLAVGKDANLTATHDLALKTANVTGGLTASAGNDLSALTINADNVYLSADRNLLIKQLRANGKAVLNSHGIVHVDFLSAAESQLKSAGTLDFGLLNIEKTVDLEGNVISGSIEHAGGGQIDAKLSAIGGGMSDLINLQVSTQANLHISQLNTLNGSISLRGNGLFSVVDGRVGNKLNITTPSTALLLANNSYIEKANDIQIHVDNEKFTNLELSNWKTSLNYGGEVLYRDRDHSIDMQGEWDNSAKEEIAHLLNYEVWMKLFDAENFSAQPDLLQQNGVVVNVDSVTKADVTGGAK